MHDEDVSTIATHRPTKNRPTKATVLQNIQERLEKRLSKLNKKNIDRKTACLKCRNPSRHTKNKTVLQKATDLQNIKRKLVKIIKKNQTNLIQCPSDPFVLQKAKPTYKISNES